MKLQPRNKAAAPPIDTEQAFELATSLFLIGWVDKIHLKCRCQTLTDQIVYAK